jgi:hypothetical protein
MLLPPDPNRKSPSLFREIGCLSALLFLFCASAVFIYPSLFESEDPNRDARVKIGKFFNEQTSSYRDSGKFIDRQNETSINTRNLQNYYKKSVGTKLDRIITTTRTSNLTGNRQKVFLGFVEVVRAVKIQQLNIDNANKKEIQWQHLDIKSFICESDERGVDMPDIAVLDRVSDRCPVGYSQTSRKKVGVHAAKSNIDLILHEQEKKYDLNKKFAEDFARPPGFILTDLESYQYRVQSRDKQVIISARPKPYTNPLDLTYLIIATATERKEKHRRYIYQYCESGVSNIPVPKYIDIPKIGLNEDRDPLKSCPTGYTPTEYIN